MTPPIRWSDHNEQLLRRLHAATPALRAAQLLQAFNKASDVTRTYNAIGNKLDYLGLKDGVPKGAAGRLHREAGGIGKTLRRRKQAQQGAKSGAADSLMTHYDGFKPGGEAFDSEDSDMEIIEVAKHDPTNPVREPFAPSPPDLKPSASAAALALVAALTPPTSPCLAAPPLTGFAGQTRPDDGSELAMLERKRNLVQSMADYVKQQQELLEMEQRYHGRRR